MKVLSFGEVLFDRIEEQNYLGGAPLNYAAHLARHGAEAYVYSKIGDDEPGSEALRQIKELGVHTRYISVDTAHPTGTVEVTLDQGQPEYTIFENVAWDYINLEPASEGELPDFDVLYFGTLAQRSEQSRNTLQQLLEENEFRHVFYDVNLRKEFYTKEILQTSLEVCTILKLNIDEVKVIAKMFYGQALDVEAFAEQISEDYSLDVIIITAGERGCYIYYGYRLHFIEGYPAKVADTVGAGDAFSAAFTYYYYTTRNPLHAAEMANKLGAFVAGSQGAIPLYNPKDFLPAKPELKE
jgi:fructokinase